MRENSIQLGYRYEREFDSAQVQYEREFDSARVQV